MKTLFLGIALILLVGIAGFFYRNVMERQQMPEPVACTLEAKICPDGSSVGRGGPLCEFSSCALPNAEDTEIGLGFVIPQGYVSNPDPIGADPELRVVLDKEAPGGLPHNIVIRALPIPEGDTAEDVIIQNTIFEPSDMGAESIDEFDLVTIGGRTFYSAVIERFEAIIHSAYYLPRENDVLVFEVLERDVVDWMEPTLSIKSLPEHAALLEMLGTLQVSE